MVIYDTPLFSIYFGNALNSFFTHELVPQEQLLAPFEQVRKRMNIENLFFLHQVNSDQGIYLTPAIFSKTPSFSVDGDFLITKTRAMSIGIMTADCLPIIIYDTIHHAASVVHAGWRGSVLGIAGKAFEMMQRECGTDVHNIQVFFGPSAKKCCYQVSNDIINNLKAYPFTEKVLSWRDQALFFDVPKFNSLQLEALGVKKEAFCFKYNTCTICDDAFCSFRRDGQKAARQMTVVSLK